jgi:hypothetical protein
MVSKGRGSGYVAGEKSLRLAWEARKRNNLRAVKREINVTLRSVGVAYQRLVANKKKIIAARDVAKKKGKESEVAKYNRRLIQIDDHVNKLGEVQKLALGTAKDAGIKLLE